LAGKEEKVTEKLEGLGALRDHTFEERHQIYVDHQCHPATDERALGMERVQWLLEEAEFNGVPTHVLDVGSHDLFVSRHLLRYPDLESLVGIEPGTSPHAAAERYVSNLAPEIARKVALYNQGYQDMGHLPKYDWVVCFEVIEHFHEDEIKDIFSFLWKRLRLEPGGSIFLCTPNAEGPWGLQNSDIHHLTLFTKEALDHFCYNFFGKAFERIFYRYYSNCPHLMIRLRLMEGGENGESNEGGSIDDLSADTTGAGNIGPSDSLGDGDSTV